MLARPYHFSDAKALDRIFKGQGITDPTKDRLFCVGKTGSPSGVLVYRPGAFVHQLECGDGPNRRMRAECLTNFAIATARSDKRVLESAIFLVRGDNEPMKRFVESLGAVLQSDPGDLLYTLTPL